MSAICIHCKGTIPDADDRCPTCFAASAEPPNVRAVATKDEKDSLQDRYADAHKKAEKNGSLETLKTFESALKKSFAVVATDLHTLRQLATNDKSLYGNYVMLTNLNIRKP